MSLVIQIPSEVRYIDGFRGLSTSGGLKGVIFSRTKTLGAQRFAEKVLTTCSNS